MRSLIVSWALTALTLLAGAALLDGVHIDGLVAALVAAAILGFVNAIIKPVLFILTLPITLLTLGLFALVLNVLMLSLAAWLAPGFQIDGFWSAALLAIILAIVNAVIGNALKD